MYSQCMVQDNYPYRRYVQIRRIALVSHGVASNICWNNYSSKTCVQIRRIVLVSLCGVSDLFNIITQIKYGLKI
jgi:hypothetical protein